jgi:hypothetical protein
VADFKEMFEPSSGAHGTIEALEGEALGEAESDKTLETE